MARHVWSVLCRKAAVDQVNMLSIFEMIEELQLFPLPPDEAIGKALLPYPMTLVSFWTRDKKSKGEKGKQRIRLLGPGEKVLGNFDLEFDLEKYTNTRNIANTPGLLFAGLGDYEFEVSSLDKNGAATVVARIPFELKLGPDPTAKTS